MQQNKASVWLQIMRSARSLSQRRLAARVGLSNTAVSDAEQKGYASAETWARLAVYFNASTDAILWLAGVIELVAPPKNEIVDRIERIKDEMEPELKVKAEQLINWIKNA